MKIISQTRFLTILGLLAIALACSPSSNEKSKKKIGIIEKIKNRGRLIIGTDNYLPGLAYLNLRTNNVEGFEPDLGREIAKRILGDEGLVEFIFTIPDQRIPYLKNSTVDLLIANMAITAQRKELVSFSEPYFFTVDNILVRRGSLIRGVKDLSGKRVGVVKGSAAEQNLMQVANHAKFVIFEDIIEAFNALKTGHIDAISSDYLILHILKNSSKYPASFELAGRPFAEEAWGIAVDKENGDLLEVVNSVLNELKKNGKLQEIYRKNFID